VEPALPRVHRNAQERLKVAKVLRDLSKVRADKGELSYGEKKLMEQARKLLITELALARRVREETIERDIEKILN
jgi:CarD family transcriptional regulator